LSVTLVRRIKTQLRACADIGIRVIDAREVSHMRAQYLHNSPRPACTIRAFAGYCSRRAMLGASNHVQPEFVAKLQDRQSLQ
jgi:hypothetical protein